MSSLSRSMATFKIHQDDDENVVPFQKEKERHVTRNMPKTRSVLGLISTNLDLDKDIQAKNPLKITDPVLKDPSLKGNLHKTKQNFLPGNSTKDGVNSKKNNEIFKKNQIVKKDVVRTPFKEISIKETTTTESTNQNELSMSVDRTPRRVRTLAAIKLQLNDFYSCVVYRDDIFKYLKELEIQFKPKPYYMKRQPDVTYLMRTILVDWLVEVGEEYKLQNETLFMAVSYLDRFLSTMAVVRAKLQLLGTSAMFIASKFEEIYPPEVSEFTYITDSTYTKKEVLRMEHMILKVLSFQLSGPTSCTFLTHVACAEKLPDKVKNLAMYICELTLLQADPYFDYTPSMIASGAIVLAKHCLGVADIWPLNLAKTTGYKLQQFAPLMVHLNDTHSKSFTMKHVAIREKYKANKFDAVSLIAHKKLILRE